MKKHWIYNYLGRPFVANEFDCGTLVIEILRDVYNKGTILVDNNRDTTLEKMKVLIFGLEEHTEILKEPRDGCIACMSYGGRLRHVGVYYLYNGLGNIIHVGAKTGGTVTCRTNKLDTQGLKLIEYVDYKKII